MIYQEWDSEFWRLSIGRTDRLPDMNDAGIDCAWLLVPAHDQARIHEAENCGAKIMDIRVELERETSAEVGIARPIRVADVDPLAALARTAFRGLTRFYADPYLSDGRCDDLYEGWFRENVADPDVDVLMVGDGGGPAGFVTVKFEEDQASIVLIALDERYRGHGMGLNLTKAAVNHASEKGYPRISVVTQGCNVRALRAFQGAGFFVKRADVWLHKWYGE